MHRLWRYIAIFSICLWAVLPGLAHAQEIQITEVMYDLDGTDADREWLEIRNVSGSSLDLSDWRFHENDTDHLLSAADEGGDTMLAAGAYAVIAQTPSAFRGDHPDYSELLLDSAFTLSNTGETIAMTNPSGEVVAEVTYDPEIGAGGDGNSLQLHDGEWLAANPTPGRDNATVAASDTDDDDADTSDVDVHFLDPRPDPPDISDNIRIDANGQEVAIVGLEVELIADISGIEDRQHDELQIAWSLGNGDTASGEEIFYTYTHPGEYVVTLRVTDDEGDTHTDTITVDVLTADFDITDVEPGEGGHISLRNDTGRSVDVSNWQLTSAGEVFAFPDHTIFLNGQELVVPADISGLSGARATFSLPDGSVVATSSLDQQKDSSETEDTQPVVAYTAPAAGSAKDKNDDDVDNSIKEESTSSDPQVRGTSTATTATSSISPADTFADTARAAGTNDRPARDNDLLWQWGGMLMVLLVITVGTALLLRRVSKSTVDPIVQTAKFDINEIGENKD